MIKSWADARTKRLFETGKAKARGLDVEAALNRLASLNALNRLRDVSPLRSVGLHRLKGDRKRQWAMNINGPWRLCFRFANGDAYDVEIVDYH